MKLNQISIVLLLCLLFCQSLYAKERRLALVIGNSTYHKAPLANPANDARAIAKKLEQLGFKVTLQTNSTQKDMENAITQFGQKLAVEKDTIGLFFYAGHGIQSQGKNYLIPVANQINREKDLRYKAVNLEQVSDEMGYAQNKLNILILDACRNNPLTRSFRNAGRGMARLNNVPSDILIAYSASPDNVAEDGDGSHSPYTQALLESLNQKGWSVEKVFKEVNKKVRKKTHNHQKPWTSGSIVQEFQFNVGQRSTVQYENSFWDSIDKNSIDELEAYLSKYPQGHYIRLALIKIRKLQKLRNSISQVSQSVYIPSQQSENIRKYRVYNNGTVKDIKTGLMWKRCAEGLSGSDCLIGKAEAYSWNSAVIKFKNISYAGYSNWRLPTMKELRTLVYCSNDTAQEIAWYNSCANGWSGRSLKKNPNPYQRPTINQQVFPNTSNTNNLHSYLYWSSLPNAGSSYLAWSLTFKYGITSSGYRRSSELFVRLVRVER